ncbi:DNA gyrase subunit A [Dermatophilus congolensis]|uniref:DNA topoisomerase (ATP-hydrolyzing) n=1 Tax=Dermatophilus congolensis TaxID=1863 RepID=A0AA46H0L1_9MICO|nr:DNA topoisomerase IV subunit A [Dermatophilus congolensis]STD09518.1 DNA gyrase subunit A [Dermatophilus congolensis]
MAPSKKSTRSAVPVEERIVDIDVEEEMQGAFLEYAYSVIYSRALPDARDGLKPVQRRIMYAMRQMGLRPDRSHVKSARITGEVMGKYHPHGDVAIYDAIVRLAQPFTMRVPLVDGHGNFGSLDDGPAAARYTEARMAAASRALVENLDEDTVDFVPNYDDSLTQPSVLPAQYPNLLVNGASGIAVGMATNMPPHNLREVVAACQHLLAHPDASLDDIMRFIPGPDLPGGGRIVGLDGIRDAYATGRGTFKTRATAHIEKVTARKQGIVVTELPYLVGPEKAKTKIADLVKAKKIEGISDIDDFTDHENGLRLVIEIKNGFNPEAVLEKLYKLTPLEDSFGINNVALVDGRPQTMGLLDLLHEYVNFRITTVRRRSQFRLGKRKERLHLVEGLLVAILDIDRVIALIRASDDTAAARAGLMEQFSLTQVQADYILELQLRRLTKFSRIELENEQEELLAAIADLEELLADEGKLRELVSSELGEVADELGTARRTVLLESAGTPAAAAAPLEVADDPCYVLMSSTGLIARTRGRDPLPTGGCRSSHDGIAAIVPATVRGEVGVVTSAGKIARVSVLELPTLVNTTGSPDLSGGTAVSAYVSLAAAGEAYRGSPAEVPLTLCSLAPDSAGLALGTAEGVVKRVNTDYPPSGKGDWSTITLKGKDRVVGAVELSTGEEDLVFITSDAYLLRFSAEKVRPQGRAGGGVAGIKLAEGASVLFFGAVDTAVENVVVTGAAVAGRSPGSPVDALKVTPLSEYPSKGRATGGVRTHRFLRDETHLGLAFAGAAPVFAASLKGAARSLPEIVGRRDGSGSPLKASVALIAPSLPQWATATDEDVQVSAEAGPQEPSVVGRARGLATQPGFDLDVSAPARQRPHVSRDDYDPDSLEDVVQTGQE